MTMSNARTVAGFIALLAATLLLTQPVAAADEELPAKLILHREPTRTDRNLAGQH